MESQRDTLVLSGLLLKSPSVGTCLLNSFYGMLLSGSVFLCIAPQFLPPPDLCFFGFMIKNSIYFCLELNQQLYTGVPTILHTIHWAALLESKGWPRLLRIRGLARHPRLSQNDTEPQRSGCSWCQESAYSSSTRSVCSVHLRPPTPIFSSLYRFAAVPNPSEIPKSCKAHPNPVPLLVDLL